MSAVRFGIRQRLEISGALLTPRELINALSCDIVLPPGFLDRSSGQVIDIDAEQRRFPRVRLRIAAALSCLGGLPAIPRSKDWKRIMVLNVSRCGIGFLHSELMFPEERGLIVFPEGTQRQLEVKRCRRIGPKCFEVGGEFDELLDNLSEEHLGG